MSIAQSLLISLYIVIQSPLSVLKHKVRKWMYEELNIAQVWLQIDKNVIKIKSMLPSSIKRIKTLLQWTTICNLYFLLYISYN